MIRTAKTKLITVFLAFAWCVCVVMNNAAHTPFAARAEEIIYTEVLNDLRKDKSFSITDYPEDKTDYSIKVIQIAESVNKELFVYAYQPSGDKVTASSVNISTTINDEISFYNYKLGLLSGQGTVYKYKVKDFTVSDEKTRYYCISSVFRCFDEVTDEQATGGNTISEVSYEVGRCYCFETRDGEIVATCVETETIVVTDKFVGYVRYNGGFAFYANGSCDSHFVAFDTDKPIDKLYEADVYYVKQSYGKSVNTGITVSAGYTEKQEEYAYLKYTDKVSYTGQGIGAATFRWDRIESVEDFIENTESGSIYTGAVFNVSVGSRLTEEAKAELKGKKWVLRFAETPYRYEHYSSGFMYQSFTEQTFVGEVTILRLKFETDGIVYNLGVIDNKQTGGTEPINETEIKVSLNNHGGEILKYLLLILVIILLAPFLPSLSKGIMFLISLPLKIIAAGIRKIKKKKKVKNNENG